MQINELEEKIKQANLDYYSKGESDISDDDYDRWILELKEKDPNNPLLNQVGDDATSENKIKLPVSMGSQEKVRIGEADLSKLFPSPSTISGIHFSYSRSGPTAGLEKCIYDAIFPASPLKIFVNQLLFPFFLMPSPSPSTISSPHLVLSLFWIASSAL